MLYQYHLACYCGLFRHFALGVVANYCGGNVVNYCGIMWLVVVVHCVELLQDIVAI